MNSKVQVLFGEGGYGGSLFVCILGVLCSFVYRILYSRGPVWFHV